LTQYNTTSTDYDLFWVVINTYSDINNVDSSSAFAFANYLAFISHELCKAFTNRGNGFITSNGCEISDICERRGPDIVSGGNTFSCCISHTYEVDSSIWRSNPDPSFPGPGKREFGGVGVEQYWSNWNNRCRDGDEPISASSNLHTPILWVDMTAL